MAPNGDMFAWATYYNIEWANSYVQIDLTDGSMYKTGADEAIRDSEPTGDETIDLIRQFLRGDSDGPITRRRMAGGYEQDILDAAEGR